MDKLSTGVKALHDAEEDRDENESAGDIKFEAIELAGETRLGCIPVETVGMANECKIGPLLPSDSEGSPNWNIYISDGC